MTAPTTCPECTAGKHGNCSGDAWDDEEDRPTICDCYEADHHGAHWPPCPWCSDRIPAEHLDAHLAADHGITSRPTSRRGRRAGDSYDLEGENADRESDRLDRINESRLP